MRKSVLMAAVLALATVGSAHADVKSETVEYTFNGKTYKGYLAYDDKQDGRRPGVLVVHEWWGLNDYAKKRADELAKLGYVAFAADMFGDGKIAKHPDQAKDFAMKVRENEAEWMGRANAALQELKKFKYVDPNKLAAIGYCFGGSTVVKLAFAEANIAAAVSFHGALPTITADDCQGLRCKLLICHGEKDPFIPAESVQQFKQALLDGRADFDLEIYPGAQHSFTVADADQHGVKGLAYDKDADAKSWAAMKKLFEDKFGTKK